MAWWIWLLIGVVLGSILSILAIGLSVMSKEADRCKDCIDRRGDYYD